MENAVGFLTNNPQRLTLAEWLVAQGERVVVYSDPLDPETLLAEGVAFLLSYGYSHIIRPEVIAAYPGRVINLHVSVLPWNRGADPNIWSFLDATPKGVTIHQVDAGLDTGAVLLQESFDIDPSSETLSSSYDLLHTRIEALLMAHWEGLRAGAIEPRPQSGEGTFHLRRELDPFRESIDLDRPVAESIAQLASMIAASQDAARASELRP